MELATQIFDRITSKQFRLKDEKYWLQIIRLAALCHDLGHLPFSHAAEKEILGPAGHEEWTMKAISSEHFQPIWALLQAEFPQKDVVADVLKMAIGEKSLLEMGISYSFSPEERVLSQVITGDFFGADRIDYLLRDAQCTGVAYGLFDYHQLIEMLCIVPVIPNSVQNFTFDKASAPDLQQAKPMSKQAMCKHMGDADSCKDGDARAVKSEVLNRVWYNSELQLGIEENGIESCEALLLARHFMHQRVYQYSSVKAYKFHLTRFMQTFFEEGSYLENLQNYLSLSDSEILTALRRAAKDPNAPGHIDADAVLRRDKRFKAILLKEGIDEKALVQISKELGLSSGSLFWELTSQKRKLKGLSFPVLTRSGTLVNASDLSQISIPSGGLQWAFVAPQYEHTLRLKLESWQ